MERLTLLQELEVHFIWSIFVPSKYEHYHLLLGSCDTPVEAYERVKKYHTYR